VQSRRQPQLRWEQEPLLAALRLIHHHATLARTILVTSARSTRRRKGCRRWARRRRIGVVRFLVAGGAVRIARDRGEGGVEVNVRRQ